MAERHDYYAITEVPGLEASREQIARIYHRYRFALDYVQFGDFLEIACGIGIGLGYLAGKARKIVGGDIDKKNIRIARGLYANSAVQIYYMDAHALPFGKATFDLVLLFEAIYYLDRPEIFIEESSRVLRNEGTLMICTVNKDWADFHPSSYARRYFSAQELFSLLKNNFRHVELYGAFPSMVGGIWSHYLSILKRMALYFNLIPGSLKARSYLKRLFLGPLTPLPDQIHEGMGVFDPPVLIVPDRINTDFKIIYAVAKKYSKLLKSAADINRT